VTRARGRDKTRAGTRDKDDPRNKDAPPNPRSVFFGFTVTPGRFHLLYSDVVEVECLNQYVPKKEG